MELNPQNIIKRHHEYPDATETLIESYAFSQYKKAVHDAHNCGQVVKIPEANIIVMVFSFSEYNRWKDFEWSKWYSIKDTLIKKC
jgi:hypothetical protein